MGRASLRSGPVPAPSAPPSLSHPQPLAAPTADDDLLGSSVSCKTSSIPYHSPGTMLGPAGPSSFGRRRSPFFDPLSGWGWDGDKLGWPGGAAPTADTPLPGSLPSFAFSFPRPDLTALPTPAALHQEGDLEPTGVWEIHLKNRDAGAWPGAGLKDCEQGTVLRSLLAGEKRWTGSLLGGDPEEAGLEGGYWVLLCTSQPGWGRHHAEPPVGRWVVGPEPGRPECHPLAIRPPPLTLLSWRLDSVLPAPLPAATLGPHGGLTTEPAPWMLSGMLDIQLVLNACLMKESLATETQWTPQASVQASGQCRLAQCPLPHSSGPTESQKQLLFPFPRSLAPSGICEWGGRGVPSGDSSPQAGTAPWWSVSGTSGWASPVLLEPQALIQTDHPPGGPCPRRHPAGICLLGPEGVNGCPRGSKACSGGPLTCQGPSKESKSLLSGAGS